MRRQHSFTDDGISPHIEVGAAWLHNLGNPDAEKGSAARLPHSQAHTGLGATGNLVEGQRLPTLHKSALHDLRPFHTMPITIFGNHSDHFTFTHLFPDLILEIPCFDIPYLSIRGARTGGAARIALTSASVNFVFPLRSP